jgi:peptidoglycan/LPS O-acetylase OafA/YrhL
VERLTPVPEHEPAQRTPRIRHMPGLDGLRGLAVLAVVLFHVGHLQGGYLGVDLFFVLSGFLITSLLLTEGGRSGHIGLARFWERRARRLLPALGLMLVGVAAYARFAAKPEELHTIRWDGVATLLYVANWRDVFARSDYWALFTAPSPLEHTWSLAIEEQFYLVWPLVFVAFVAVVRHRRGAQADRSLAQVTLWASLALGAASLVASAALQRLDGWNRVYYGTDTRAFAILAGAAVAATTSRFPAVRTSWRRPAVEVLGLLGGVVLLAAWFRLDGGSWSVRHGGLAACSVAGALVIAAVSSPHRALLSRLVSFAPLRWLGLISYGVYLYHWPIIVWLDSTRVGFGGWRLIALQCAVTLAVSVASYRFVEQPIRHGSGWPRRANVLVPATGFVAVALVVVFATVGYRPLATTEAAGPGTTVPADPNGARILVIGNSVAFFLADEGLKHVRSTPQFALANRGRIACAYPGSDSFKDPSGNISVAFIKSCDDGWLAAIEAFKPDLVIYTRDGISPMAIHHDGRYIDVCSSAFHDWYVGLLEADARAYAKVGAKLALVTAVPSDPTPDPERDTGTTRARYLASVACGNRVLHDVAEAMPQTVRVVDLEAHLCPGADDCEREVDGVVLREDGSHFRGRGAVIVARWILGQLGVDVRPAS